MITAKVIDKNFPELLNKKMYVIKHKDYLNSKKELKTWFTLSFNKDSITGCYFGRNQIEIFYDSKS
jgi:uncharacterized membrane-anchored protein YitT (DUF2179 family)